MTDSLRFLDAVAGLPEQLASAHEAAAAVPAGDLPKADTVRNIVVLGMGGSGIAGDVVAAARRDRRAGRTPVHRAVPARLGAGRARADDVRAGAAGAPARGLPSRGRRHREPGA